MAEVKMVFRADGPIQVTGEVELCRPDGSTLLAPADAHGIFLCRCGQSKNKPFCDGQHKRAGWRENEGQEKAERAP